MKNEQKQQAKNLYFQTDLSKSEIAERLDVNRRTIMLWCQEENWEKLKNSGRHLPALVAEKCYYLIDRLASSHLTENFWFSSFSHKDADAINKLSATIKRLKNRSTVNESMEMFNFFLQGLKRRDPELAAQVLPHVEEYFSCRKSMDTRDFLLEEFNDKGNIPFPEKEIQEKAQDDRDHEAFTEEMKKANNDRDVALENWQKGHAPAPIYQPGNSA